MKQYGSLLLTRINFTLTWIINYTHYEMLDETTYPFPNFNGATIEVWESRGNLSHICLSMWFLIHTGIKVE